MERMFHLAIWAIVLTAVGPWANAVVRACDDRPPRELLKLSGPITLLLAGPKSSNLVWIGSQDTLYEYQLQIDESGEASLIPLRKLDLPLGQVTCGVLLPDAKRMLVGGGDPAQSGTLLVIDCESLRIESQFELHADSIAAIAVDPSGRYCACGSWDQMVSIVELDSGAARSLEAHTGGVRGLVWVAAEELASASEDQSLRLWDLAAGKASRSLEHHSQPIQSMVSLPGGPDGTAQTATIGLDRTLRIWQPQRGRMVRFARLPSEPTAIWAGNSHPDFVLIGDREGAISKVDWQTGHVRAVGQVVPSDWIEVIACLEEVHWLAGTNRGRIMQFFP